MNWARSAAPGHTTSVIAAVASVTLLCSVLTAGVLASTPGVVLMLPSGESASIGPLKLSMGDGSTVVTPLSAAGIMPGDQVGRRYRLDGPEGLPFSLTVQTSNVRDADNGCGPSEALVDAS